MRLWWLYALFLAALFAMTVCPGCGGNFKRITTHQSSCKKTRGLLGQLKQRLEVRQAAERVHVQRTQQAEKKRREELDARVRAEAEELARREVCHSHPLSVYAYS